MTQLATREYGIVNVRKWNTVGKRVGVVELVNGQRAIIKVDMMNKEYFAVMEADARGMAINFREINSTMTAEVRNYIRQMQEERSITRARGRRDDAIKIIDAWFHTVTMMLFMDDCHAYRWYKRLRNIVDVAFAKHILSDKVDKMK